MNVVENIKKIFCTIVFILAFLKFLGNNVSFPENKSNKRPVKTKIQPALSKEVKIFDSKII